MRNIRATILVAVTAYALSILVVRGQVNEIAKDQTDVTMTLAPVDQPLRLGDKLLIRLTIYNRSQRFVVLNDLSGRTSFDLHITGVNGGGPPETANGCKLHQSTSCAKGDGTTGDDGRMQDLIIPPGKKMQTSIDVTNEYKFIALGTYLINVEQRNLRYIQPDSKSPPALWIGGDVGVVRSNNIEVQVVP